MVNYGLKDKVALITGANNPQGIGATTAFARVESRLKEMYADYMILESDISNEAAVKEIYSKVFERY